MTRTTDTVALNDWQAVGTVGEIASGKRRNTRLLGQDIIVEMDGDQPRMFETNADGGMGAEHPAQILYGHVWTTLGAPEKPPLDMPEFEEDGRRLVCCGALTVGASALRIVENFLDMSHFPYVHTGILGEEPITEVNDYKIEIREPEDEIWATDCSFFQPQAAASADDGQVSEYMYRVSSPFVTVLYKTCPVVDGAWDLVGIFVQPKDEAVCDVHTFMLVFDETSTMSDLVHFQQEIFLQDRSILENQVPPGLPLDPKDEMAIKADGSSMLYRRWLRKKGLTFGTHQSDAPSQAA
ncbi:MAG: aromatic ring-hydroxylating dioxygenase subunit alpha [Alphaproteobacteria bacterium]